MTTDGDGRELSDGDDRANGAYGEPVVRETVWGRERERRWIGFGDFGGEREKEMDEFTNVGERNWR